MNVKPLEYDAQIVVRVSQETRDALAAIRPDGEKESEQIRRLIERELKRARR